MTMTPQQQAELIAMIEQMLATNSGTPNYAAIASPLDRYGQPEPWDLANQAKAYNTVQDWGSIMSDPAILGGMMPDTITPGMLNQVTYEPLTGWNKVEAAAVNQPNSLSGMIAAKILAGQDAFAAYTDIVTILSNPDSDEYQMLAPLVPAQPTELYATNDPLAKFDLDAVKKLAESYQSAVNNEPIPQVNPETGDFVRDQSGRIATEIQQETPQGEWFRETGTPLPWEEWTTNDFASPVQQKQRDESFAKTAKSEEGWRDLRSSLQQPTLTGADREAYIANLVQSNMTTPDYPGFTNQSNRAPDRESREMWVDDALNFLKDAPGRVANFNWGDPFPVSETQSAGLRRAGQPPTTTTQAASAPSSPAFRGDPDWATPGGGSRKGPARGSRYEAELRLREAEKRRGPTGFEATPQTKRAWEEVTSQRAKNHRQLADEALRRRMITQLMEANVTPYTSTMNSRRSQAQQSGFGY